MILTPEEASGPQVLPIRIFIERDAKGTEAIRFEVDGKPRKVYLLTPQGQLEVPPTGDAVLRPVAEAASPCTLGFLLPPDTSASFTKTASPNARLPGAGCAPGQPGCETVLVPVAHTGTVLQAQWTNRKSIKFVFRDKDHLTWNFGYGKYPIPDRISYTEHNFTGDEVASATYKLTHYGQGPESISKESVLKADRPVTVMKNSTGYGPYEPSSGDPWLFHTEQASKWNAVESATNAPSVFPWGPVGVASAILIAMILTVLVRRRV